MTQTDARFKSNFLLESISKLIQLESIGELLEKEIANLSYRDAKTLDFEAKNAWRSSPNTACKYRIISARIYEEKARKIGERGNSGVHSKERLDLLKDASFSYDKAAKNAELLGDIVSAVRCRIRACRNDNKLHNYYRSIGDFRSAQQVEVWRQYAIEHIARLADKI